MLIKVEIKIADPMFGPCHVCHDVRWVLDVVTLLAGKSRYHSRVCHMCFDKGVEITREGVKSLES